MEREKQVDRKPILREDFGPGRAGENAYLAISLGTPCKSLTTHQKETEVPLAIRTLGFDVSSTYDFVEVCSQECENAVRIIIEKESRSAPSFDRNGFGRA